jgi:hypothetical protein
VSALDQIAQGILATGRIVVLLSFVVIALWALVYVFTFIGYVGSGDIFRTKEQLRARWQKIFQAREEERQREAQRAEYSRRD